MKNLIVTAFFLLMLCFSSAYAQKQVSWSPYLETNFNSTHKIGLRVGLNQSQFAMGIGADFGSKRGTNRTEFITADYLFHFAGKANLHDRKPWYLRNGFEMEIDNVPDLRRFSYSLVSRLGREFHFSKKFGLSFEAGGILLLKDSFTETGANPHYPDESTFPLEFSLALGIFFKI